MEELLEYFRTVLNYCDYVTYPKEKGKGLEYACWAYESNIKRGQLYCKAGASTC